MNKTTCQICARDIKANTGVIAHHGYTRPGWGEQTGSCMGARHLPYEQSRDLIPGAIANYKVWLQNNIDREQELLATPPPTMDGKPGRSGEFVTYDRPDNFDAAYSLEHGGYMSNGYSRMYAWKIGDLRSNIKNLKAELAWLQRRYDAWVPPTA